jgi:hypothetical protein
MKKAAFFNEMQRPLKSGRSPQKLTDWAPGEN